jgi:hypothetical protein
VFSSCQNMQISGYYDKKTKRSTILASERLTANAEVATVLGSIPATFDTVESEGRQMKQC